ncbi:hypothetical protein [Fructobacillus papyrifericola]|uniref:Late embryogenesis abundant protein n=1 Tax=Fructobacillus papyrifericola TaxID=2713172 RepID=A0ABS5QSJ2_9LACO|nr:hypothetical protein [Fructobacillus papyrifericola]MBS9336171.1 hypothetical protein [Fructobacillus papyrifericola]
MSLSRLLKYFHYTIFALDKTVEKRFFVQSILALSVDFSKVQSHNEEKKKEKESLIMKNFLLGVSLFGNAALAYALLKDDDRVADLKDKAQDAVEAGKAKGQEAFAYGKQKAADLTEAGKQKAADLTEAGKEKANQAKGKFQEVKGQAAANKEEAAKSLDDQLAELKERAGVSEN